MDNSMQIDGFYYDPVKKRHFRIVEGNKYHPHQNTLTSPPSSTKTPSSSISTPTKNICRELTHLNTMIDRNSLNVQECLLSGRFAQMKGEKSRKLEILDYRGNKIKNANCDYLIGESENDSLFGVWSSNDGNGSVIQRVKVNDLTGDGEVRCSIINAFPRVTRVEDLCMVQITDSPCSAVMCLTNHFKRDCNIQYSSLNIQYLNNDNNLLNRQQVEDCSLNYEFCEPSFSCCVYTHKVLAIGSDDHIRLFTPPLTSTNQQSNVHTLLELRGKATSLKFSQDGKRLYSGTNYGHLISFDVTSKKRIVDCDLQTKTITYLHPLKNDNQLIVSCHDSKLFLIDNRNTKTPIISFPNHVNDCKKIPVSVDESVDIICSSGQDYKVRLWSLRTGKLLHEIEPPKEEFQNPLTDSPTMNYSWYSHSWKSLDGEPSPMILTCMRDKIKVYRKFNDNADKLR